MNNRLRISDTYFKIITLILYCTLTYLIWFKLYSNLGKSIVYQLMLSAFLLEIMAYIINKNQQSNRKSVLGETFIIWVRKFLILATIIFLPIILDNLAKLYIYLGNTSLKLTEIGKFDFTDGLKVSEFINISITIFNSIIMGYIAFNTFRISEKQFQIYNKLTNGKAKLKMISGISEMDMLISKKDFMDIIDERSLSVKVIDVAQKKEILILKNSISKLNVKGTGEIQIYLASDTENKIVLIENIHLEESNHIIKNSFTYDFMVYNNKQEVAIIKSDMIEKVNIKMSVEMILNQKLQNVMKLNIKSEEMITSMLYEVEADNLADEFMVEMIERVMSDYNDSLKDLGYAHIKKEKFEQMTVKEYFDHIGDLRKKVKMKYVGN